MGKSIEGKGPSTDFYFLVAYFGFGFFVILRIFQAAAKARKDSLASEASSSGDKKLQNQFSFVERATQTMNNAFKVSISKF